MEISGRILRYWPLRVQEWTSVICCIAMVAGLLFSRAILSVAMIVLFLNALHPHKIALSWNELKKNLFARSCILFFLCYVVSGLWSRETGNWIAILQIKAPFLLFPFAMFSVPLAQPALRKIIVYSILFLLMAGMIYSAQVLLQSPDYLLHYPHLPSPVEGDYIRFTVAIVFGIQLAGWFFLNRKTESLSKLATYFLLAWILLATVYIHVQAAKSGLVCFYVLVGTFLYVQFAGKRKWLPWVGLPAMLVAGALCVMLVPSLRNQMDSVVQEQKVWQQNDTTKFAATVSVVPRLLSYKIATRLIAAHPVAGTGAGDIQKEMDLVYEKEYPQIPENAKLLPHNQFLCTALGLGIPLSLSLLLMAVAPLYGNRRYFPVVSTFLIMMVGLMIEPMLETQYGIFVYLFFTLLTMRLPAEGKKEMISAAVLS